METVNTDGYMTAGYVVTFLVMGLYVFSIYIRNRNLKRDLEIYESMDKPGKREYLTAETE